MGSRVRRYEEVAQHNAPFIVVILTWAVLLVFDGVRELFTNVTVRARLAALVPLLSHALQCIYMPRRGVRIPYAPSDIPCSSPCARTTSQSRPHRICAYP